MTPPIRMVSVPVAALDALKRHLPMLEAAAIPTKSEVFVVCGHEAREMHDAIAMLTAAPVREEGGADWRSEYNRVEAIREAAEGQDRIARGTTDPIAKSDAETQAAGYWKRYEREIAKLNALAAREEAPAEAGTIYGVPAHLSSEAAYGWSCGYEAALRAQPQAREEAQPVAWVDPYVLERLEENLGGRIYPRRGISGSRKPLYDKPPAPEAEKLRVAVEAMRGAIEWDKGTGYRMPYRVRDPLYAAIDLAALQQEGR